MYSVMHLLAFPVNSFCFATNSHTAVAAHETLPNCGIQSSSEGDVCSYLDSIVEFV